MRAHVRADGAINHTQYLYTCTCREQLCRWRNGKKPPFPARGSHMTGLSICQTRVKYSLERRSPSSRLMGAGEAPWGLLSRGEAHLGALMRSALYITWDKISEFIFGQCLFFRIIFYISILSSNKLSLINIKSQCRVTTGSFDRVLSLSM